MATTPSRSITRCCRRCGCCCDGAPEFLFCENDTNTRKLWKVEAPGQYFKDGINDYVVNGDRQAVNPARLGTKAAAHYPMTLPPGGVERLRLRLAGDPIVPGFDDFDEHLSASPR